MKLLTILVVLLAVTGINVVFRDGLYNPAAASHSPERAGHLNLASGVERVAAPDRADVRPRASLQVAFADLSRDDCDGELMLARIAAECGNRLFDKARRLPDQPHLLNLAAHHYRACLAHEPTCPADATFFYDVRVRLKQIDRLLARRDGDRTAPAGRKTSAGIEEPGRPAARPVVQPPVVNEARPPAENPAAEKDEGKMVGPDGVIYQRAPKR